MTFTGTSNGSTWHYEQARVVHLPCLGPCRARMEIRADGDWKRALMHAPLPRGMVVIDRAGSFVGIMCPKCGSPGG